MVWSTAYTAHPPLRHRQHLAELGLVFIVTDLAFSILSTSLLLFHHYSRPPITSAAVAFAGYHSVDNILYCFSRLTVFSSSPRRLRFFFFFFAVLTTRLVPPEFSCYECVGTRFPSLYGQRKSLTSFAYSMVIFIALVYICVDAMG